MKSIIKSLLFIGAAGFLFGSCKKDENRAVLNTTNAHTTLKASASTFILDSNASAANNTVLTLSWDSVQYGVKVPITYTLQFDSLSGNFSAPISKVVGVNILKQTFTVTDLNKMATNLGIAGFTAGNIHARVMAKISDSVALVYSNTVTLNITPFVSSTPVVYSYLWVVGDYMGWSWPPSTSNKADSLASIKSDGKYEGFVNIPAGGTLQFKLCKYYGWDGAFANAGTPAVTTGNVTILAMNTLGGTSNNLTVPAGGYYYLFADTNTAVSTLTTTLVTSLSVLGTATGNTAIPLTYNVAANDWTATGVSLSAGTFKYVINNGDASSFSLGAGSGAGKVATGGAAISVTTAGSFKVILNLSNPGRYVDTLQ